MSISAAGPVVDAALTIVGAIRPHLDSAAALAGKGNGDALAHLTQARIQVDSALAILQTADGARMVTGVTQRTAKTLSDALASITTGGAQQGATHVAEQIRSAASAATAQLERLQAAATTDTSVRIARLERVPTLRAARTDIDMADTALAQNVSEQTRALMHDHIEAVEPAVAKKRKVPATQDALRAVRDLRVQLLLDEPIAAAARLGDEVDTARADLLAALDDAEMGLVRSFDTGNANIGARAAWVSQRAAIRLERELRVADAFGAARDAASRRAAAALEALQQL